MGGLERYCAIVDMDVGEKQSSLACVCACRGARPGYSTRLSVRLRRGRSKACGAAKQQRVDTLASTDSACEHRVGWLARVSDPEVRLPSQTLLRA